MNSNTKVGCHVYDCKHCNCSEEFCTLDVIDVCNCSKDHDKESTMCNSFECK